MEMKTFEAGNREEWRNWLKEHHSDEEEIWLVYFKKHTNKPSITYIESVEEAICFGWIDGIKKRIDDERYTHRFTPRRKDSKWSPTNIGIAQKMIKAKKMTSAGLIAYNQRKEYDRDISQSENAKLAPEYEELIKEHKIAWKNFNKLPPGHKRQYIMWISSAKKEETKRKRTNEAIKLLEANKKLGMK